MLYISCYTPDYEDVVQPLRDSFIKFDLPFKLYPYADQGNWVRNCMYKATVIRQAMADHPKDEIVFLDADAEILKPPVRFDELKSHYDFAAHYNKSKALLSGTLYFNTTPIMWDIVEWWIAAGGEGKIWDQHVLKDVIHRHRAKVRVCVLPESYCHMACYNDPDPVIKQRNAGANHGQTKPRLVRYTMDSENRFQGWMIHCPACGRGHLLLKNNYKFNGDQTTPTFTPEVRDINGRNICRFMVVDGNICYDPESTHRFSGQRLPLLEA